MTRAAALIALVLLAAGCSNASQGASDEYLNRGAAALNAGNPRTARIELLNAIKADPNDRRARLLQAKVHIALGDGVAAEAELRRARELGVSVPATATLMAEALLLESKAAKALAEARAAPPQHAAQAARLAGRALMASGDQAAAGAAFERAIELGSDDSALWVDVARYRRSAGNIGGATEAADRAVRLAPRSPGALLLRGELTRTQYGPRAALPWFDRALEADPDNATVLLEKAATLGELGRMGEMLAASRAALKVEPGNPVAYYLQAVLAARAGNFALARALYAKTGNALDVQPAPMLFAGALDYEAGNYERAADRFRELVELQPDNSPARRLLAASELLGGDAASALAAIRPLADAADADHYALALAADAAAKLGQIEHARGYRARAATSSQAIVALGRNGDAEGAAAVVGEIRGLIVDGDSAAALDRARDLRSANPGVPDAHMLVGDVLMLADDTAGAAQAYRGAANLAFTEPVALRLIEALAQAGDAKAATQVLTLFLDQNPRSVSALLLAGDRYMAAGEWAAAADVYRAVGARIGGRDAALDTNLAWAYARQGDFAAALPLARKAWRLAPANPATADAYGWMLFKSGRQAEGLALLLGTAR